MSATKIPRLLRDAVTEDARRHPERRRWLDSLAGRIELLARDWLDADPLGLSRRLADLLELDRDRVRLWLFARCAQEALHDAALRATARRLAP